MSSYGNTDSSVHRLAGRDLALIRGDRALFNGLSFELTAGQLLLIEGPNGSGKTSLLRVIAGLVQPEDGGTITWRGADIAQHRQAYHDELVWLGHRPGFKGDLTVAENLRAEAGLRRTTAPGMPLFERLGIAALTGLPFRVLSAGQQRRIALARLLLADAALWLMDEPFTNLDAGGQTLVAKLLQAHLAGGGTAVVATHHDLDINAAVHRIRLT